MLVALLPPLLICREKDKSPVSCPPGFESYLSSCYAFCKGPSTKAGAAELCREFSSMLACPTTQEELDFITQRAIHDKRDYWSSHEA